MAVFSLINTLQLALGPLVFQAICQINFDSFSKTIVKVIRASELVQKPLY